jgi:hypothetical protein
MSKKQRKTVDYKLIMTFKPCEDWPLKRVKKAVPKRIKLAEFLKNEEIPPKDRLWVALRNKFFSDKELRLLACDIAERALTKHRVTDDRSWNAIKVSRSFANGKATKEELAAARSAADAAAADARAAADAARAAASARAAAWSIAYAIRSAGAAAAYASDAAYAVANAAADARDAAGAYGSEYKWVCEKLIETLNNREQ